MRKLLALATALALPLAVHAEDEGGPVKRQPSPKGAKAYIVNIKDGSITSWQVNLEVTFVLDDAGAAVDASSD